MRNKHYPMWVYTLSSFFALLVTRNILEKTTFSLNNFSDRIIGIAVLQGIDITSRSTSYLELSAIFITSFFVCLKISSVIWNSAAKKIGFKNLKNERNMLFTISSASIFMLIFHYINGAEIFVNILNILKFLILLPITTIAVKIIFYKKDPLFIRLASNYNLWILSLLLPIVVFFTRWIVPGGSFVFTKQYMILFAVIWGLFWIVLRGYFQFVPKKLFDKNLVSLSTASIPLLMIPFSVPLSNEFQYSLSNITNWSERRFSVITLGILLISSSLIFIFNQSKNTKFKFAKNIYLPIFVATITLFAMHSNFLDISNLDMFHHGENLISTQQFFQFGSIPFINLYPTHGLSYMLGQTLYSLVNGYTPFSPWLWEWIAKIFEVLLLYFVLSKITNSFFSALTIAFLPIIGVFGGQAFVYGYNKSFPTTYYFASFLVGLVLIWTLKRINFLRMLVLWLSCLFLIAWRVDFGFAGLSSTLIVLLLATLQKNPKRIQIRKFVRLGLKSFILIFISAGLGFAALTIFAKTNFWITTLQVYEFVKFQGQAQGLITVLPSLSPLSVFQYLILPSVSAFYVIYVLYIIFFKDKTKISSKRWLLLFIAIFSIIISVRSVQRQTLAILGYNPYLFAFLLISIPIFISRTRRELGKVTFLLTLLLYQFVLPNSAILTKSGQLVSPTTWHNKESRVHVNDVQYINVASFLSVNLDEGKTFLDLTSSPLLYVVTGKKFINYFIPPAYYTSEVIQKATLKTISTAYDKNEIPILIFRQPFSDGNIIDGVPNEIRSYRLYEYVYQHYHPSGYINGYYIWTANNFDLKNKNNLLGDSTVSQNFNLQKLPLVWAKYDSLDALDKTKMLDSILNEATTINSGSSIILNIKEGLDKSTGNYLHLKVQSDMQGTITISYGINPVSAITFDLVQSDKPEDYLIRISSQYYWSTKEIDNISILPSTNIKVVQADIRKGD